MNPVPDGAKILPDCAKLLLESPYVLLDGCNVVSDLHMQAQLNRVENKQA